MSCPYSYHARNTPDFYAYDRFGFALQRVRHRLLLRLRPGPAVLEGGVFAGRLGAGGDAFQHGQGHAPVYLVAERLERDGHRFGGKRVGVMLGHPGWKESRYLSAGIAKIARESG